MMMDSHIRPITVHERSSCASTPSFLYYLCLVFGVLFESPKGEGGGGKRIV